MTHPYGHPSDCEWRGIILRVLYMFTKLDITCPFIPETVDVTVTQQFQDWLSSDPGDYDGKPFHNGLKLFLWLISDCYHLYDSL
jgi:hypothetical protein